MPFLGISSSGYLIEFNSIEDSHNPKEGGGWGVGGVGKRKTCIMNAIL